MARAFIYGLLLSLVTAAEFELQGERPKTATEFVVDAHGHAKEHGVHHAKHPADKSGPVTAHLQHTPKTDAAKEHAMTMETQKSTSSQTSGAAMVRRDTRQQEVLHKKMDETEKHGMKHSKSTIVARERSSKDARANVEKAEAMIIQARQHGDPKLSSNVDIQKPNREQSGHSTPDAPIAKVKEDEESELHSYVDAQKPNREESGHSTPDAPLAKVKEDEESNLASDVDAQKQARSRKHSRRSTPDAPLAKVKEDEESNLASDVDAQKQARSRKHSGHSTPDAPLAKVKEDEESNLASDVDAQKQARSRKHSGLFKLVTRDCHVGMKRANTSACPDTHMAAICEKSFFEDTSAPPESRFKACRFTPSSVSPCQWVGDTCNYAKMLATKDA